MHGKLKVSRLIAGKARKDASGMCRRCAPGVRRGFTLTEVVVASALLIVAIVPILKGLTSVHLNAANIERKTRSLALAQAKLDDIRARSIYNYSQTFSAVNQSLDGAYLANISDTTVSSNLRKITVRVGFDLNDNRILASSEELITLETLVARRW